MEKVIDVEAVVRNELTTEGLFGLGLTEDALLKAVAVQSSIKMEEYAQAGLSLDTVVTPETRGLVKDIRGQLNKDIAKHKADLKELKEKELKRFTTFEKAVLGSVVTDLEKLRDYGDVSVKDIEAAMVKERGDFASQYWDELNLLTPVTKTYEDLMFKVSMNDTDNKIQKGLKEVHDVEVAKEMQEATERNTLALMPRAERLLELYNSGLTMTECIIKDQEEEAVRVKVIADEAERIAKLAVEKEVQERAETLRKEEAERERVRLEELRVQEQAKQAATQQLEPTTPLKEESRVNTPKEPEQASVAPVQNVLFAQKETPVVRNITIDVIGTDKQFEQLMMYAQELGIQVTGKPTVKLASVGSIFGGQS